MLRALSLVVLTTTLISLFPLVEVAAQEPSTLSLFQHTRYIGTATVSEDANTSNKPKKVLIEMIPIREKGKLRLHFTRMEEELTGERFYPTTYLLQQPMEAKLTNDIGTFSAEHASTPEALIPQVNIDGNLEENRGSVSNLRIELTDHKGALVMKADELHAMEPTGYEGLGLLQTDYKKSSGEISRSAARLIPLLVEPTIRGDQINFVIKTDPSISNSSFSIYNVKISAKLNQESFEGQSEDSNISITGKISEDRSKIEGLRLQIKSGHETYRVLGSILRRLEDSPLIRAKQILETVRLEPEGCSSVQAIPQRAP